MEMEMQVTNGKGFLEQDLSMLHSKKQGTIEGGSVSMFVAMKFCKRNKGNFDTSYT